jgi:hypothetical protein
MLTLDTDITQLSEHDYIEGQHRLEDRAPDATIARAQAPCPDLDPPF